MKKNPDEHLGAALVRINRRHSAIKILPVILVQTCSFNWVWYPGTAAKSKPRMYPDPQEITLDYCQSRTVCDFQFISVNQHSAKSSRHSASLHGTIFVSAEGDGGGVHSGFRVQYNVKEACGTFQKLLLSRHRRCICLYRVSRKNKRSPCRS